MKRSSNNNFALSRKSNMAEKHIKTKKYHKGNEHAILELFRTAYDGRELPLDYWRWRFQKNPGGPGMIYLAWDGDVIAAHYAVTGTAMRIGGDDCAAGLSGTTMTHPGYRGRGLFPILARNTYERMADMGMTLVYGFPNAMSHRGFVNVLKWKDIYEIPMLRMPITSNIETESIPEQICELSDVDKRFDDFWSRVCDDYDIIARRDQAYLNWRYISNPAEHYRLIAYIENNIIHGYAFFKKYENQYQVIDLLIERNAVEIGGALLRFVIREALRDKSTSVSLWLNVNHALHHRLEKMGFGLESPVTYFGGLFLNSQTNSYSYDFRRWYITMGDSDVF